MKKVSILTFAICLSCVVLAGCSGENSSKTESASSQSSETTEAGETKMPDTTAAIESTTAAETTESNGSSSRVGSWEYAEIAQLVKNLPAMQETTAQFLGREDPLEKG